MNYSEKDPPGDGLNQIDQPLSTEGGEDSESTDRASGRMSEELRHKERSVTLFDYERLTLEAFPRIVRVAVAVGAVAALILIAWNILDPSPGRNQTSGDFVLPAIAATPTWTAEAGEGSMPDPGDDLVTATPEPSATLTPEPILVNFNADSYLIERGECTVLRWEVVGASHVRLLDREVEAIEAEEVCPEVTSGYLLIAENTGQLVESFFEIEVTEPENNQSPDGCLGYDQNGQLICKTDCSPNDPGDPCLIAP